MENSQEFIMLYNPIIGKMFTIVCQKREILFNKILVTSISIILLIPIAGLLFTEKRLVGPTSVASILAMVFMYQNIKNVNAAKEVGYIKIQSIVPVLGIVCVLEFAIPIALRWSHGNF